MGQCKVEERMIFAMLLFPFREIEEVVNYVVCSI
jgi:hypothetical protein